MIILDSPVYRDGRSGEQMVRDREATFSREHGFPSNAIPCENFLTHQRLEPAVAADGTEMDGAQAVLRMGVGHAAVAGPAARPPGASELHGDRG